MLCFNTELTANKQSLFTFVDVKPIYLSILFGILLVSCQNNSDVTAVYISGEIINPKSNVVVLMQKEQVIDSLLLDADNTFGASIPLESEGLFYFQHGSEFQYLYLEPKDSIRLRLNTWDFDETLVFGGKGAQKNQLLLDLFLANEKELDIFYSYFVLPENEFQEKINDARNRHTELVSAVIDSDLSLSKQYLHLAQAAIDYPLYRLKELYPYYHKKATQSDDNIKVSDDFYDYHKIINLNDSFLSEYYAYENFVTTHLHNLAYQQNDGVSSDENFQTILLEFIATKITIPEFKNRLLHRELDNLFFSKPNNLKPKHISLFYDNCSDTIAVNSFKQLLLDKENLPLNSSFPDFYVTSTSGEQKTINSLIEGKSAVVYFWTSQKVSDEYLTKRIKYLRKKFPEVNFVGINTEDSKVCKANLLNKIGNQYYLPTNSKGTTLLSTKYPRAILINAQGKVVNSFALLSNYYIEKELKSLLD